MQAVAEFQEQEEGRELEGRPNHTSTFWFMFSITFANVSSAKTSFIGEIQIQGWIDFLFWLEELENTAFPRPNIPELVNFCCVTNYSQI